MLLTKCLRLSSKLHFTFIYILFGLVPSLGSFLFQFHFKRVETHKLFQLSCFSWIVFFLFGCSDSAKKKESPWNSKWDWKLKRKATRSENVRNSDVIVSDLLMAVKLSISTNLRLLGLYFDCGHTGTLCMCTARIYHSKYTAKAARNRKRIVDVKIDQSSKTKNSKS